MRTVRPLKTTRQAALAVGALLVVGLIGVPAAVAASAAPSQNDPAPQAQMTRDEDVSASEQPNVSMGNFNSVNSLDRLDRCLYNNSVYPEGGNGFADSSLPYEGLSELDRAFATFRAELLRTFGADVAGVEPLVDEMNNVIGATVNVTPDSAVASTSLSMLAPEISDEYAQALSTLGRLGVQINVVPDAVQGFVSACTVQDLMASGELFRRAGIPSETQASAGTNAETGQLEISIEEPLMAKLKEALAPYGNGVVVLDLLGVVEF